MIIKYLIATVATLDKNCQSISLLDSSYYTALESTTNIAPAKPLNPVKDLTVTPLKPPVTKEPLKPLKPPVTPEPLTPVKDFVQEESTNAINSFYLLQQSDVSINLLSMMFNVSAVTVIRTRIQLTGASLFAEVLLARFFKIDFLQVYGTNFGYCQLNFPSVELDGCTLDHEIQYICISSAPEKIFISNTNDPTSAAPLASFKTELTEVDRVGLSIGLDNYKRIVSFCAVGQTTQLTFGSGSDNDAQFKNKVLGLKRLTAMLSIDKKLNTFLFGSFRLIALAAEHDFNEITNNTEVINATKDAIRAENNIEYSLKANNFSSPYVILAAGISIGY